MTQILATVDRGVLGSSPEAAEEMKKTNLALELLSGCGMILRAQLRTSPADERCHGPLSFNVHHSSAILRNVREPFESFARLNDLTAEVQ